MSQSTLSVGPWEPRPQCMSGSPWTRWRWRCRPSPSSTRDWACVSSRPWDRRAWWEVSTPGRFPPWRPTWPRTAFCSRPTAPARNSWPALPVWTRWTSSAFSTTGWPASSPPSGPPWLSVPPSWWNVACRPWGSPSSPGASSRPARAQPSSPGRFSPLTECRGCSGAWRPPSPGRCPAISSSSWRTRPPGVFSPRQGRRRTRLDLRGRWWPAGWRASLSGLSSSRQTWWRADCRSRGPPPPCWSWWPRSTGRRGWWRFTTGWDQQSSEHSPPPGLSSSHTSTARSGSTPSWTEPEWRV